MLAGHRKRLTEPSWAGTEQPNVGRPSASSHRLHAVKRLERADERRLPAPFVPAHEAKTPVDPVRAVDIRSTRRTEHRGVPRCAAVERMARRIVRRVRLHLDNDAADPADEQGRADEIGSDLVDAPSEEVLRVLQNSFDEPVWRALASRSLRARRPRSVRSTRPVSACSARSSASSSAWSMSGDDAETS